MKRIITIVAIILAGATLGWVGGNIWADRAREAEPIGFDIGSRVTYWTKGVTAGGIAGVLIAAVWVAGTRTRKRKSQNKKVDLIN